MIALEAEAESTLQVCCLLLVWGSVSQVSHWRRSLRCSCIPTAAPARRSLALGGLQFLLPQHVMLCVWKQ